MDLTIGKEIYVNQTDYAHGYITDSNQGERGKITHIGDSDPFGFHAGKLCYIEWIDRPIVHKKNGSFRPFTQLWLSDPY